MELLLQHQADPQLREPGQELPIIVAASRGALSCVQILWAYGADPGATEFLPSSVHPGQIFDPVRRKTAMEVASPFSEVVEALQTAISAAGVDETTMHGDQKIVKLLLSAMETTCTTDRD